MIYILYAGSCSCLNRRRSPAGKSCSLFLESQPMEKNVLIRSNRLLGIALLAAAALFSCSTSALGPEDKVLPLMFSTPNAIKPAAQGEMARIVITASGGTLPYEFYVIPETEWLAGDLMHDMLERNDFSRLHRYAYSRNLYGSHTCVIEVTPGTSTTPRYYWVAMQDGAQAGILSGTNMLSWWKRVAVYGL